MRAYKTRGLNLDSCKECCEVSDNPPAAPPQLRISFPLAESSQLSAKLAAVTSLADEPV